MEKGEKKKSEEKKVLKKLKMHLSGSSPVAGCRVADRRRRRKRRTGTQEKLPPSWFCRCPDFNKMN